MTVVSGQVTVGTDVLLVTAEVTLPPAVPLLRRWAWGLAGRRSNPYTPVREGDEGK